MSLNPLTLLSDFINERGSAAILGKHVDFFKDQITALKEERAVFERKLAEDASLISDLKSENARIQSENQNLRQQIQDLTKPTDGIDDDAYKILKFYFDGSKEFAINYVAQRLGMPAPIAEAHASDLYERDFIRIAGGGEYTIYGIATAGTKYLMKHPR